MHQNNLIHIVTCQNSLHIYNYLKSVSNNNNKVNCKILLLSQGGDKLDVNKYNTQYTNIEYYMIKDKLPLSVARNVLLKKHNIDTDSWYMFPDDDSTFDRAFFDNFNYYINTNLLIDVKCTPPNDNNFFLRVPNNNQVIKRYNLRHAISVNMIIKGNTINQVGFFDEDLGVGCYYGAGEDNDYFLRCLSISEFKFCKQLWNYHPMQDIYSISKIPIDILINRYKSYGRGVIYMLKKHNMTYMAILLIIRGYMGCLVSILKLKFKMCYVYFIASNERFNTFVKK